MLIAIDKKLSKFQYRGEIAIILGRWKGTIVTEKPYFLQLMSSFLLGDHFHSKKTSPNFCAHFQWVQSPSNQRTGPIPEQISLYFPLQVKVRPSVREVVAVYTVDDGSLELVIKLPANYPLGQVTVESGKKVGVGQQQWRHWMLQLTTFLMVKVIDIDSKSWECCVLSADAALSSFYMCNTHI